MKPSSTSTNDFWNKVTAVSFIFSICILMQHNTSNLQYFADGDYRFYPLPEMLVFWFRNNLSYLALSAFFVISGMLMFRDLTFENSKAKIKRRFASLAIPFFIWNILSMAEEIVVSGIPFLKAQMVRHTPFEISFSNIAMGLVNGKGTWFLLALIVLSILSPLIYICISRLWIGLLCLVLLYALDLMSLSVFDVFHGADNVLFYSMGGILGLHFFRYAKEQSPSRVQLVSAGGLILSITALFIAKHVYSVAFLTVPLNCLMILLTWNVYDHFALQRFSQLRGAPMFIYVAHFHVVPYVVKIFYLLLPKQSFYCIPNFIISSIITACICLGGFAILRAKSPKTLSILIGGR